jgi:hypothetical protein
MVAGPDLGLKKAAKPAKNKKEPPLPAARSPAPQQLTSYPAPHPRDVVVIHRSELTTHFCFFKVECGPN